MQGRAEGKGIVWRVQGYRSQLTGLEVCFQAHLRRYAKESYAEDCFKRLPAPASCQGEKARRPI